jgi:6-phosphogluconolactonase
MKSFEVRLFSNDTELAGAAAAKWLALVQSKAVQSVALSGGRIAKTFFESIVSEARAKTIELAHVDFFWADERCVPPTDPESNFYVANQYLLQPLKIGEQKIHRLKGELNPTVAVELAIEDITRGGGNLVLDLVILGIGEDGHIASLFPNTPSAASDTTAPFLHISNSPKPPPNRLSLSYATIAAAKDVWVLASGSGKRAALKESLDANGKTPLARVVQSRQTTKIFTDIEVL